MKVIAVINQKGGVGKTTTVANLGAAISDRRRDVCLVDMDSQSHLSLHFGIEPADEAVSVYDVLLREGTISQAAEMLNPHLCLVPSTTDLAGAEIDLGNREDRFYGLRDGLRAAKNLPHDYVFIDCPPSLGLLTLNALAAADEVLIPLQPHFLAMQGLGKLLDTIQLVQQEGINPHLRVSGVVLCMYESVMKLTKDVVEEVRGFLSGSRETETPWSNARVFESVIRRNVRLAECPSHGVPIFQYDPKCNGAADYNALADEFLALQDGKLTPVTRDESSRPTEHIAAQPISPPMPYSQPRTIAETDDLSAG